MFNWILRLFGYGADEVQKGIKRADEVLGQAERLRPQIEALLPLLPAETAARGREILNDIAQLHETITLAKGPTPASLAQIVQLGVELAAFYARYRR